MRGEKRNTWFYENRLGLSVRRDIDGTILEIEAPPTRKEPIIWIDLDAAKFSDDVPGDYGFRATVKRTDLLTLQRFRIVVDHVQFMAEIEGGTGKMPRTFVQPVRDVLRQAVPTESGIALRYIGNRKTIASGSVQSRGGVIVSAATNRQLGPKKPDRSDAEEFQNDYEDDYQLVIVLAMLNETPQPHNADVIRNDLRHVKLVHALTREPLDAETLEPYRLVITYKSTVIVANYRYSNELGASSSSLATAYGPKSAPLFVRARRQRFPVTVSPLPRGNPDDEYVRMQQAEDVNRLDSLSGGGNGIGNAYIQQQEKGQQQQQHRGKAIRHLAPYRSTGKKR